MALYDDRTGQVYTETSAHVTTMVPTWASSCTGRKKNVETYRHIRPGASSLLGMSFRCLAWNGFETDSLEYMGWVLADKFYTWMKNKNLISFKDWLAFKRTYPDSEVIDRHYSLCIPSVRGEPAPQELPALTKHLNSLPSATLTYLSLQHLTLTSVHLMSLLRIPNLAVLILQQNYGSSLETYQDGGIHDHFMGTWRRDISEKKSFPKLRVLVFRGFHTGFSATFSCFSAFPKLRLCNYEPCVISRSWTGVDKFEPRHQSTGDWQRLPPCRADIEFRHKKTRLNYPKESLHYSSAMPTLIQQRFDQAIQAYETPDDIRKRRDRNMHQKMKLLYEKAAWLTDECDVEASNFSISVSYGDSIFHEPAHDALAWYVRACLPTEVSLGSTKRARDEPGAARPREQLKKRNIKSERQKDIGAVLGGFT